MKSAASESVGESEQEVLVSRAGYLPGKARVTNVTRSVQEFQNAGYQVVGLDAGGEHTLDTYTGGKDPVVIVIGSERKGISRLVRENCDVIVSIPMTAWVESLNASVAAGAVLSEFARRRRAAK
ncbi:RNA methyltransferase [Corynebacterium striatum]|nr:RNA methyltransferase [Corynebacterium striatum]MBD0855662.1 RNA methyltransferase [Corynebacterium striatum]PXY09779.1 RNA methyltransferase [Corynebacterium striatum]PXY11138.1 RNA methyltransferase [Corynebacterium striatum]PXY15158.1 RNA methyltransferase [Corynebacterium striatum]